MSIFCVEDIFGYYTHTKNKFTGIYIYYTLIQKFNDIMTGTFLLDPRQSIFDEENLGFEPPSEEENRQHNTDSSNGEWSNNNAPRLPMAFPSSSPPSPPRAARLRSLSESDKIHYGTPPLSIHPPTEMSSSAHSISSTSSQHSRIDEEEDEGDDEEEELYLEEPPFAARRRSHSYETGVAAIEASLFQHSNTSPPPTFRSSHSAAMGTTLSPSRLGRIRRVISHGKLHPSQDSSERIPSNSLLHINSFDIHSNKASSVSSFTSGRKTLSSDGNESEYPASRISNTSEDYDLDPSTSTDQPHDHHHHHPLEDYKTNQNIVQTLCCFCFDKTQSLTRVSTFIVRYAPCFLCCGGGSHPMEVSVTDRDVLFRLNFLCGFFALVQTGVGGFVAIVMYMYDWIDQNKDGFDGSEMQNPFIPMDTNDQMDSNDQMNSNRTLNPNFWNLNFSLGILTIVGFILLVAVIVARKSIKEVNLNGALRFYFLLLWVFPIEFFSVLTLIDVYRVSDVWVEHWWHSDSFRWFRDTFCVGTEPGKCTQPFRDTSISSSTSGVPQVLNVTMWCMKQFNHTDCVEILEESKSRFKEIAFFFYIANGVWGVLLMILVSDGSESSPF